MKSIITLLGTFFFSVFIENFARIVIIFYKQEELIFYGIQSMPGPGWIAALFISVLLGSWLAGMLTITIVPHSPLKHLTSLFILMLIWRLSEYSQLEEQHLIYSLGMICTHLVALSTVLFINKKYAKTS